MPTALDVISNALKIVGVLADGEQPTDDTANQALSVFNDMLDSWNAESTSIYTTQTNDFPFVLNKQSYTLGTGGDFDIPRPAKIDGMSAILLNDPSNPVEVPIDMYTVDQWQNQVPVKIVTGTFPLICYDTGDFPLRMLNFWPIPVTQPNNFRLYSWQALAAQTLTAQVAFPPGYAEAIRYNLAVRMGEEFNHSASQLVVALALQSLARVKTMNAPDLRLQSDLIPVPAGYNYRADLFGIGW